MEAPQLGPLIVLTHANVGPRAILTTCEGAGQAEFIALGILGPFVDAVAAFLQVRGRLHAGQYESEDERDYSKH
jgi:hypothetical protein